MDRLERGVSGGFIVFDLERFTRQPKDGERMIELAVRGLGVLDSESEYDLTTPNGKKAFRDAINAPPTTTACRPGPARQAAQGTVGGATPRRTCRPSLAVFQVIRSFPRRTSTGGSRFTPRVGAGVRVHRITSARPSPSAGSPAVATSSTAGPATASSYTRMDR
jgi:hypothetical protein